MLSVFWTTDNFNLNLPFKIVSLNTISRMKKTLSLLTLFLALSKICVAQGTWTFAAPTDGSGSIGAETGRSICTDAAGNTYVVGVFNGAGAATDFDLNSSSTNTFTASTNDGFIASYDRNGNFRWKTIVSGTGSDFGAPAGGICTNGTFVWVAGSVNVTGSAPAPTITSSTNSLTVTSPGTGVDAFVAKMNCSNGAVIWQQGFGGTGANDFAMGICVDPNGCAYVSGAYSSTFTLGSVTFPAISGTISDIYIAKFTPGGVLRSVRTGGSTVQDMINAGSGLCYVPGAPPAIVATGHTGAATASFGAFTGLTNSGAFDACLVELDTALAGFTNALVFGSTGSDELLSAVYDPSSGGVFVSGFCSGTITFPGTAALTGLGGQDIVIARYSVAANNFVWSSIAGGLSNDRGWCVTVDTYGGLYLSGYTVSAPCSFGGGVSIATNAGLNDLFVTRYNTSGTPAWTLTAASTGSEEARGIASYVQTTPSFAESIFVTGITNGSAVSFGATTVGNDGGNDFYLAKINIPSSLPVELSSFSTTCEQEVEQLNWTSESEYRFDFYEIEKSYDLEDFTSVGIVDAVGESTTTQAYSFELPLAIDNTQIYYRLRMVDLDGSSEFSDIISGIFCGDESALLKNYSFNGRILTLELNDANASVELFSITGQRITPRIEENNENIRELQFATTGQQVYILRVTSADGSKTSLERIYF